MKRSDKTGVPSNSVARDVMTAPAIVASASSTVRSVASLMLEHGVNAVPIVDDAGMPVGMASDGGLAGRKAEGNSGPSWLSLLAKGPADGKPLDLGVDRSVSEVMSAPLIQVGPDTPADKIAELLKTHHIKRAPVIENNKVIGIVSRADLLLLVGRGLTAEAEDKGAGLLRFLESLIGGQSLRGVDHAAGSSPAAGKATPAAGPTPFSATALRAEVKAFKTDTVDKRQSARQEATLERRREIKAMLDQHVSEALWREMLDHAELAAKSGEQELLLLRFPSELCTDGGRKIDVAEAGWEDTLRGEPGEILDRWRKELRPQGFGLSARIVSYEDGVLGDVGLYLTWSE